ISTVTRATGCCWAGALSRARERGRTESRAGARLPPWPEPFVAGRAGALPAGTGSPGPGLVCVTLPSYQNGSGAGPALERARPRIGPGGERPRIGSERWAFPALERERLGPAVDLGAPAPEDRLDGCAGERFVLGEQPAQGVDLAEAAVAEQRQRPLQ